MSKRNVRRENHTAKQLRQGYIDDKGVGHIPLAQVGKEALVDAHWFHYLSQFNWSASKGKGTAGRWYAKRSDTTKLIMARVIMGVTDPSLRKIQVDHKDRNATLDNREANLRLTISQNPQNVGLTKRNKSGFKGVHKEDGRWRARIQNNGNKIHLGCFDTAIDAARAYNAAASKYQGEFAVLNDLSRRTF